MRIRVVIAVPLVLACAAAAHAKPLIGVASGTYASKGQARPLASVGARWTYNWAARSALRGGGVGYVPMAWGSGSVTSANVATWQAARRAHTAAWLLGFNEPDLQSQANMTPDQAIRLWSQLQSTGLRLVSPAMASPFTRSQTHPGRTWLDDFMTQAQRRHLRVDAIALHFYGDWTNPANVDSIEHAIEQVHARWHKPVWITETGVLPAWKWEGHAPHRPPTAALARAYLRRVMAMLARHGFVARVAWFMDRCTGDCAPSSLLDSHARPTALGRALRAVAG